MKREFKGCCFYVQIALFCPTSELRSYHVAPYGTAFALRRKMLRGLLAKLKKKDDARPEISRVCTGKAKAPSE
jgi:hypothetical protein